MKLNVETYGKPTDPGLLLVHGFLSSNAQWLPNIEALSRYFHLVLAELWGHGKSPMPSEPLSVQGYLDAFEAIRNELGTERWGVIGQSYAAGLTIRYAIAKPQAVSGLMVTNSRSALGNLGANGPRRSTQPNSEPRADNRHLPIHPVYAKRIPEPTRSALIKAADNTSADAIQKGGRLGAKLNSIDLLTDIPSPFVIANGIHEKSFQKDMEAVKSIPGLRIADLDGGHAVNIEAAAQFNELTRAFFTECFIGCSQPHH